MTVVKVCIGAEAQDLLALLLACGPRATTAALHLIEILMTLRL